MGCRICAGHERQLLRHLQQYRRLVWYGSLLICRHCFTPTNTHWRRHADGPHIHRFRLDPSPAGCGWRTCTSYSMRHMVHAGRTVQRACISAEAPRSHKHLQRAGPPPLCGGTCSSVCCALESRRTYRQSPWQAQTDTLQANCFDTTLLSCSWKRPPRGVIAVDAKACSIANRKFRIGIP